MTRLVVALLLAVSCTPKAKAPTAIDAAKIAVIATDAALATAITATPDDAKALKLIAMVPTVKTAEDAIENSKAICPTLPELYKVAVAIECARCKTALEAAQEALACPQ